MKQDTNILMFPVARWFLASLTFTFVEAQICFVCSTIWANSWICNWAFAMRVMSVDNQIRNKTSRNENMIQILKSLKFYTPIAVCWEINFEFISIFFWFNSTEVSSNNFSIIWGDGSSGSISHSELKSTWRCVFKFSDISVEYYSNLTISILSIIGDFTCSFIQKGTEKSCRSVQLDKYKN